MDEGVNVVVFTRNLIIVQFCSKSNIFFTCLIVNMKCIEICAGIGGMSLGLHEAGFEHTLLVEKDTRCVDVLALNGFKNIIHSPIQHINYKIYSGIDLVAGGVPCQGFSIAGKSLGENDSRNLWPEAIRCVRECQPKCFLFENSANMCGPKHLPYLTRIIREFESMGFTVTQFKVDASNFGVPQRRKRLLLLGKRAPGEIPLPPSIPHITVRQALASLGHPNDINGHTAHPGARTYKGHTPSNLDLPSKSITSGVHGPGGGNATILLDDGSIRYYTVREIARLQTFPDSFKTHNVRSVAVKQLGNACPPKLIAIFATALVTALIA